MYSILTHYTENINNSSKGRKLTVPFPGRPQNELYCGPLMALTEETRQVMAKSRMLEGTTCTVLSVFVNLNIRVYQLFVILGVLCKTPCQRYLASVGSIITTRIKNFIQLGFVLDSSHMHAHLRHTSV